MTIHHTNTTTPRRGRVALASILAVGALSFTSGCSFISDITGGDDGSTAAQTSENSDAQQAGESTAEGSGASGEMTSAVAALSDDDVRGAFHNGAFYDCDLGEGFYTESYLDATNFVVDGTEPGTFFNDQSCVGYVAGSSEDVPGVYVALQASAEAQGKDDKSIGREVHLDDDTLGDWLLLEEELPNGFTACLIEGPEKTPLDSVFIATTVACDYAQPLMRSLQDLAVRYQELEGEQPSFDYAGDTERPGDLAIDEDYADKLDAAQGTEEVGRFEHEIDVDLELKVSNFKQKGDEAMDLGILCFDVEFNKKLRMTQPPNLVMHQPDGSHILARAAQAPGSGSKKVNYCSEQALLFTNADVVIGASEDSLSPSATEASHYKPLWKIHTEIRDSEITVTD